jgi:hypothetical protein
MATELAELVVAGIKRTTASLARDYGEGRESIPRPGDFVMMLDGKGRPALRSAMPPFCTRCCRWHRPGSRSSGVAHYNTDPRERHVELLGDDLGDRDIDPLAHVHLAEIGTVAVAELKVR